MHLPVLIPLGIKASLFLLLVGLGLGTTRDEAMSLLRTPRRLFASLTAMLVIVPAFAVLAARYFQLEPAVNVALATLALSPVPPLWPRKTRLAGGAQAYTIGLFVATSLLSVVTLPLLLRLIGAILAVPIQPALTLVARLVALGVLVPLSIGIATRRWRPGFAERVARPITLGAYLALAASGVPLFFKVWPTMTSLVGDGTLLTMVGFVAVGLMAGQLLGGHEQDERSVLALASATRHPGIALAVGQLQFPGDRLIAPAILLYVLLSVVTSIPYVLWSRRRTAHPRGTVIAAH